MLRSFILILFSCIFIISNQHEVFAANNANSKKTIKKNVVPIQTGLVVNTTNGKVLYAKNPRARIHPASLTKWMTLYLTFDAVNKGQLRLDQKLYISENAASKPPCKMGLPIGDVITVEAAILSLIVGSHNDIAVVLAEAISGSEAKFALAMTRRAKALGMKNTNFKNASGLHHQEQLTTALDLVKLSLAIKRDYPRFYPLLSQTEFTYRDKTYHGHNPVMKTYKYAKASKTGFTNPSGYNLITHASTANKDIIAVVTGHKTAATRNRQMVVLLDKHLGVETATIASNPLAKKKNVRLTSNSQKVKKRVAKKRRV
jgi:serine-type D-Ala-D-Ala carboxypeptidase (penicillin-binding protein 5/6)